ncbi:hypothetical protein PLUTE_b0178 [Pseudoalteromonas luteoviolacea DSM 6061]|nr:hypothetical protein [Pseudoalteromonas luteoviolacea DSM 6061]
MPQSVIFSGKFAGAFGVFIHISDLGITELMRGEQLRLLQ